MDPQAIKICGFCGIAAPNHLCCSRCKAVFYCSKGCQRKDWHDGGHKHLCAHFNHGEAGQIQHSDHRRIAMNVAGAIDCMTSNPLELKKMFGIFKSGDDSDEALEEMKRLFRAGTCGKWERQAVLFQSLALLMELPKEMATLRTSPLLVALEMGCDPNYLSRPRESLGSDGHGSTALHWLAEMALPRNIESHEVQVILARQLLDAGANVNAETEEDHGRVTPLHRACHSAIVTNLGLIRLLLERGANPNARTVPHGETPLMQSCGCAMSAAMLLLTFPSSKVPIDVNVESSSGSTFLWVLRKSIENIQIKLALGFGGKKMQYILKQHRQVEAMVVKKGAIDKGW